MLYKFFFYFGCTISWFFEKCGVIQVFLYLAVHHCMLMGAMQAYLVLWVHHYVILRILWCKTSFLVFDCTPLLFISVYECYTRAYLEFLVHHFVFMINKVLYKCCITLVNLHGCYTSLSCIWFMPLRNILRIVVVYKFF